MHTANRRGSKNIDSKNALKNMSSKHFGFHVTAAKKLGNKKEINTNNKEDNKKGGKKDSMMNKA